MKEGQQRSLVEDQHNSNSLKLRGRSFLENFDQKGLRPSMTHIITIITPPRAQVSSKEMKHRQAQG